MAGEDLVFTLAWDDIDPAALAEEPGSAAFRRSVTEFLQQQYQSLGGQARIVFDDSARTVTVAWAKKTGFQAVEAKALDALNRREYATALPLLKALIAKQPDDAAHYYNLGMVLSDQGRIDEAVDELERALAIDPRHVHAMVAIGVARARVGDLSEAISALRAAVALDPENTYAHQNLGACLLKRGDYGDAEQHFRTSLKTDPANVQSRLGLAQALESAGQLAEADEAYHEIIKSAGHGQAGELAKEGRTRIAHAILRTKSAERPDVVMYCLGALERFAAMPQKEIERIGQEIAILGMRGLDINDAAQKYTLKSIPGSFSGLHLVSLMYVAYQKTAPGTDVGIDLSREYAEAVAMFAGR
jgi:tetratricopeptide (TPR) repeat protein